MKNFKFKWLLLSFILSIASINQAWADDYMSTDQVFYFKPSELWKTGARFAVKFEWVGGSQSTTWYSLKDAGETDVYYAVAPGEYYDMYFCRMNGSEESNSDDTKWNQSGKLQWQSANKYNYFQQNTEDKSGWQESTTWTRYAPKMKTASVSDNGTAVLGGSGTEGDPYLILVGTTIKVSATAESYVPEDADQTKRYNFKTAQDAGSFSSGQDDTETEYEYTASSSINVVHKVKVSAYNRYSLYTTSNVDGTPAESSELYYKTVQYYVAGNGGSGDGYEGSNWCDGKGWNNQGSPMTYDAVNGDWYVTFENVPISSNLKFAVTDGTWDNTWRHAAYNSSCSTNLTEATAGDNDGNAKLTITNPSNITIRFTPSGSSDNICASAVPLYNNLAVTVSPAGAAGDPSISSTYTTQATNSVSISAANANDGYTWSEWTADGGSITTSSSQSTTWSPGASGKTATANYTENNYDVIITKTTGGTLSSEETVTGHVATSADLPDATADVGYYFVNWTVTSGTAVITNATSATDATINGMTADVTVQANFARTYAYIQGRMTVTDATRTTPTYVGGSDGEWNKSSTSVEMDYDGSSKVFYRHTYKTPAQLSETQNNTNDPQYFSFKTCTTHGSINTGTVTYEPTSNTELDDDTNEKKAIDNSAHDLHFKFNSTTTNGYAILYFDQSDVWYELEHTLTYDGSENTSGSVAEAYYDHNATATVVAAGTFVKTGYTLTGWSGSDGKSYASGDEITMTENLTLTAQWTEDTHTVTVAKTSGGTTNVSSVEGIGITSASSSITATIANEAWRFKEWQIPDGVTLASGTVNSTSITINATADGKTITAVFEPRYGLFGTLNAGGGDGGMPGTEDDHGADFDVNGFTSLGTDNGVDLRCTRTLEPNTTYKFKVRDRELNASRGFQSSGYKIDGNSKLDGSEYVLLDTKGAGEYTFKITKIDNDANRYPSVEIIRKPSSQLNFEWKYADVNGTQYSGNTGGSVTAETTEGRVHYTITNNKYVAADGSITFTASPASGYTVQWYSDNTYETLYVNGEGGATIGDNTLTLTSFTPDEAVPVYALFVENSTAVTIRHNSHGHVTIGGVTGTSTTTGVTTTRTLVAVPNAGYYFAGWKLTEHTDYVIDGVEDDEDDAEIILTGLGEGATSGQTLTANFVELEKVYFRNWDDENKQVLWTDVYVYFSISFQDKCAKSNSNSDYKAQMTLESGNVYWAYVPRTTTRNIATTGKNIAFSNHDFGTDYKFLNYEAVMRSDYSTGLSMFVPRHASTETLNGTKYYKGYWKHHNVDPGKTSGYLIKRYKTGPEDYERPADNGADRDSFIVEDENTIRYSLRVDNVTDSFNRYVVVSAGDIKYITYNADNPESSGVYGYNITTTNYSGLHMSEYTSGYPRFYITPTTQNLYTLTIDMSGDEMLLTVDYPVAEGDYRLHHTYAKDATTYHSYSDIIKPTTSPQMVSMYINTANTPTLALEKCTKISPVTWTDQSASLSISTATGYFDDGNGVYQFVFTDPASAQTMSDIKLYEGEFYIKTDCAPGGWTAWKANVMEKNTITFKSSDPKTFDRSFCHWIDQVRGSANPMNVKCVIANDYNIAVSDTLVGDDILEDYDSGGGVRKPYENIPAAANVRFSYNSTTNELKRTYLSIAGENKLLLEGNNITDGSVFMLHNADQHEDFNSTYKDTILSGLSNFTYVVDVDAREKARVRLTSVYQGKAQDLIGHYTSEGSDLAGATNANTEEIMGGSSSHKDYKTLRIIYDFKTNYLMAAWLADDVQINTDKALNSDLIIIREGQGDARQITFGSGIKMTDVDTVYGVMQFNKWTLNNKSTTGSHATLASPKSRYERDLYWISFPFNVTLSDAFGMGTYGTHWIIERYDGKGRAANGFWADSESNWKFVTPYERDNGFIMKAYEGYILALDLDELGEDSYIWDNGMENGYLYFPSNAPVGNIQATNVSVEFTNQNEYLCTINRPTTDGNRTIKDSYWHCIGVPSFANYSSDLKPTSDGSAIDWGDRDGVIDWKTASLPYLYEWVPATNDLRVTTSATFGFKATWSYLVQYSEDAIYWSQVNAPVASVAARMTETPDKEYKLEIWSEERMEDQTFVRMTDDENVSTGFEFNYDLSKEMNRNRGNIWTVTADTVQVAGNSQPHPLTTTIVPVGVKIAANGEYTFSMPEGTNGGDVWLIDNANSSRTNLGLMDYTVNLTTGTYEGRFSLEFPVQNVVTEIENAANANANANADVRKVFVGGRLYILRDGKAYDATGAQVR